MEHRWHKRVSIDTTVRLIIGGRIAAVSRAMEIGTGGVSIHNPGLKLRRYQIIDIDFIKDAYPKNINACSRAMVIHTTSDIIGFMFTTGFSVDAFVNQTSRRPQHVGPANMLKVGAPDPDA